MRSGLAKRKRGGGLQKYDPERGLKTIAVAEAAIKHYARAKDAEKLQIAIREKLDRQAEFVLWWDTHGDKDKGGRPLKTRSRSATGSIAGKNGLPERYVIDRWRKKLNDRDDFETTLAQAFARYAKILEFEKSAHVSQNSGENEWYTPKHVIDAAREVLGGIDLDPASSHAANAVIQAAQIFTGADGDSGLDQPWHGRVWMNPPYAQPLVTKFCEKLANSVRAGSVTAAIVLVNNATETQWFRAVVDVASAVCFPTGRVKFWQPNTESATPLQGQALLYTGGNVDRFCDVFRPFGFLAVIRR